MTTALAQSAALAASDAGPPPGLVNAFDAVRLKLDSWITGFFFILPNLLVALIVAAIFLGLAMATAHIVRRTLVRSDRRDLGHVLGSFVFWAVAFLGFLVVITIVLPSMRPVDIFTSLGIGSVAVGFAFKDVLQNWVAGFLILIRRPFHRGDQIKIGDIEGTVQAVETRATLVKTYNGRLVIIPNTDVYTRAVTVHTAYDIRRTEIAVPVGLDVDLEKAIEVFRAAVVGVEDVLLDPAPDILPWEFSENNVVVRVRWWMKSQRSYEVRTRSAVVRAIKRDSEAAGIALPADTKISFADTPLIVSDRPTRKNPKPATKTKTSKTKPARPTPPPEPRPDASRDPEAEKPKGGELSEGVDQVPR